MESQACIKPVPPPPTLNNVWILWIELGFSNTLLTEWPPRLTTDIITQLLFLEFHKAYALLADPGTH